MDTPLSLQEQVKKQQEQIDSLQKQFDMLKNSNSISYEIEQAFRDRGFTDCEKPEYPNGAEIAGAGFIQEISITATPQTISVPDFPTTFLKLKGPNSIYYIPLLSFN